VSAPRTWLLLAEKGGDNSQIRALAAALPWPCETRDLRMKPQWLLGKPRVRPTLDHLDRSRCDTLEPPWPDLLLTMGRRTSSAALWIQEQSGGHTKIVLLGKPSGSINKMALVIGSEEILLPPLHNVFKIGLPLLGVDAEKVSRAADEWRSDLAGLPQPLVAILIGGPTSPFVYDASVTERIMELARGVTAQGGTAYVTTSRRTPTSLCEELEAGLPSGARHYRWLPDEASKNPYFGLLGLADGFVVTGDSASMMMEVASLGLPLSILPLPGGWKGPLESIRRRALAWFFAPDRGDLNSKIRCSLARLAFRLGIARYSRDFRILHDRLVSEGHAVWAGQPFSTPDKSLPGDAIVAARKVVELFPDFRPAEPRAGGYPDSPGRAD
jgi:mitochondrial fission protein ELM1